MKGKNGWKVNSAVCRDRDACRVWRKNRQYAG